MTIDNWNQLRFFHNGSWSKLYGRIINSRLSPPYLPNKIFAALPQEKGPQDVKVVILGQDPYPTPGHANGLAFSVNADVNPLPRSLQNIFKELVDDLGVPYPSNGDLTPWANQGVLLLNSCLTVPPFQPGGHRGWGWEELTNEVITTINLQTEGRVFILWGNHAREYESLIDNNRHLILKAPHPSPLSAHYGFFGSRPFSKANEYLIAVGERPINWEIDGPRNLAAHSSSSGTSEEGIQSR